jgi:hypothetical protein
MKTFEKTSKWFLERKRMRTEITGVKTYTEWKTPETDLKIRLLSTK